MSGTIVVGVYSSPGSNEALRWAVEEARLRRARIVALHAWTLPLATTDPMLVASPTSSALLSDLHDAATEILKRAVGEVGVEAEGVEIEQRVVQGPAGAALVDAAQEADLLVVGSRGHGGFVGLLLGSVTQQVLHHAPVPAVVVREPEGG
jgi:nucleotide-binding universal stress UspA family protein